MWHVFNDSCLALQVPPRFLPVPQKILAARPPAVCVHLTLEYKVLGSSEEALLLIHRLLLQSDDKLEEHQQNRKYTLSELSVGI